MPKDVTEDEYNKYAIRLRNGLVGSACGSIYNKCRYANDWRVDPSVHPKRGERERRQNATLCEPMHERPMCFIQALRRILPGEEILICYGSGHFEGPAGSSQKDKAVNERKTKEADPKKQPKRKSDASTTKASASKLISTLRP